VVPFVIGAAPDDVRDDCARLPPNRSQLPTLPAMARLHAASTAMTPGSEIEMLLGCESFWLFSCETPSVARLCVQFSE